MALLFLPLLLSVIVLASENILTNLTDLERDSRKKNDLAKVIPSRVQVESGTPKSRLSIWIKLCVTCGERNKSLNLLGLDREYY